MGLVEQVIRQVTAGQSLSEEQARDVFERVMRGEVEPAVLGALVCAMAAKGETVDELVGAARALRAAATAVHCDRPCLDTCGTGGDGISTFNVSTAAAIVAAAGGAVVAKHGNRTTSRASGSSEVLERLGVRLDVPVATLERCLREEGLAFLHAPHLHPAMKHAAVVRRAVRVRTIFNLLGPLANPAGAEFQLLGVSRAAHLKLMVEALRALGARRVWVVHGANGLCDLSICGETQVVEMAGGGLRRFTVRPDDFGLPTAPLDSLAVRSADESAVAIRAILEGTAGPQRDHTILNAAAAIMVYGKVDSYEAAAVEAARAIDSGAAKRKLEAVVELTQGASAGGGG